MNLIQAADQSIVQCSNTGDKAIPCFKAVADLDEAALRAAALEINGVSKGVFYFSAIEVDDVVLVR